METKTHTIDATDRILGRLATEVATLLAGKNKIGFVRYADMGDTVLIKNVDKIKVTGKKLTQKTYFRHSAYVGNYKIKPLKELMKERPSEVLRKAVYGMLPKNKLRAKMIKRLLFGK